jgi:hypothetical protein
MRKLPFLVLAAASAFFTPATSAEPTPASLRAIDELRAMFVGETAPPAEVRPIGQAHSLRSLSVAAYRMGF